MASISNVMSLERAHAGSPNERRVQSPPNFESVGTTARSRPLAVEYLLGITARSSTAAAAFD